MIGIPRTFLVHLSLLLLLLLLKLLLALLYPCGHTLDSEAEFPLLRLHLGEMSSRQRGLSKAGRHCIDT